MKPVVLLIALLGATWAFPKEQNALQFKRIYVDPVIPLSDIVIPRIVNGKEAIPHSIPYQAYLVVTGDSSRWMCAGSLVSAKFVLTAGHCVAGGVSVLVVLGAHNLDLQETTQLKITSEKLTVHQNYDEKTISNDIAVIELPVPVELNEYINTIPLPSRAASTATYEGANARISGWGFTSPDGGISPVLLEVNSTVISNTECNSIYGIVQDYQVCISGEGGVGSCNGDSGGPLVAGNVQIGIDSYGATDCAAGYPSASTRTNSFIDWLEIHTDLRF